MSPALFQKINAFAIEHFRTESSHNVFTGIFLLPISLTAIKSSSTMLTGLSPIDHNQLNSVHFFADSTKLHGVGNRILEIKPDFTFFLERDFFKILVKRNNFREGNA